MYEVISMILRNTAVPLEKTKEMDFLEFQSGVDVINAGASQFRILNTHMMPKYIDQRLLKQVRVNMTCCQSNVVFRLTLTSLKWETLPSVMKL